MTARDDLAERLIALLDAVHPFDRVPRAGFLLRGVAEPESVAAHSHGVALLTQALTLARPHLCDGPRAVAMALLHDLAEARLMDIPMPAEAAFPENAKAVAEDAVLRAMLAPFGETITGIAAEYAAGATPEARLVKGLDKVQMMARVAAYERERRGLLDEFWENPRNFADYGIPVVRELFDAICRAAGRTNPAVPRY